MLETFVVVRAPGRVPAASGWPAASLLDVAPTVADLCGFAPDSRWEGTPLLGREFPLVESCWTSWPQLLTSPMASG